MNQRPLPPRNRQHGAATLVVVMLMFFVISLTAAYASRNLIFEQRTSANQYRSTQSFEAAEAGLEWAIAMLNSGGINDSCQPDATRDNFRQRYLDVNASTGVVTQKSPVASAYWAACGFDGSNWQCSCTAGAPSALTTQGTAFAVRFVSLPSPTPPALAKPGVVRIEVNGCNGYDLDCLTNGNLFATGLCQSTVCALLALHSGVKSPPTAAVTAYGNVGGTALIASNQVASSGGVTVHAGGAVNLPPDNLRGLPGTPPALTVRPSDSALQLADADDCLRCNFASVFGLRPTTYRQQPASVQVDCTVACDAAAVALALAANRGAIVYLKGSGGLRLDNPATSIGTATSPVVLKIDGPLVVDAAATTSAKIHGLVYASSVTLDAGEIQGALVSAGNVTGAGVGQVTYDADALTRLKLTSGSFVRVPGGWRDFQ